MRIVTVAQMKSAEHYAMENGINSLRLMENAGSAAARFIRDTVPVAGAFFVVLCGRGNNGGDGFVVARKLYESGANVILVLAAGPAKTPDAAEMQERTADIGINCIDYTRQPDDAVSAVEACSGLVDAVYGTGFHGEVGPELRPLFEAANRSKARKFALDMPSGANADDGSAGAFCLRADDTVTFAAPKLGHFLYPAAQYCGRVHTVNIGIPDLAFAQMENSVELLEESMVQNALPVRRRESHKGDYGRLACVCGSRSFSGAAWLAFSGALRCGAGLITAYVPQDLYLPLCAKCNEVMVRPLPASPEGAVAASAYEELSEALEKSDAALIGCGLSQCGETLELVRRLVRESAGTVILDADGINAFAGHIDLLRETKAELVLTPHPGEMARLLGISAAEVQRARLSTAVQTAGEYGVTVVLKGAGTVVAAPDGRAFINPTGNPGMARGGSGDVLAGMIAAFAAEGLSPCDAACCGVFLHGAAGDRAARRFSQYGMTPTDLLGELPKVFRHLSR